MTFPIKYLTYVIYGHLNSQVAHNPNNFVLVNLEQQQQQKVAFKCFVLLHTTPLRHCYSQSVKKPLEMFFPVY